MPKQPMNSDSNSDTESATVLIGQAAAGDKSAMDALIVMVYPELKRISAGIRRKQFNVTQTYDTTALVNEAWIKINQAGVKAEDRKHFYCTMAKAMKQVLINHSIKQQAQKNMGIEVTLDGKHAIDPKEHEWLLSLDRILDAIEKKSPRMMHVFQLKYFLGMNETEITELLDISPKTIRRDWLSAKAVITQLIQ